MSGALRSWRIAGFAAVVFAVTFLVFAPSARFWFLRFDDTDYVLGNPHLREGLTAETALWALGDVGYASNWHPLAWISHAADLSLARGLGLTYGLQDEKRLVSGLYDCGFARLAHAHNVLLHAANAALLFALLVVLTGRGPGECAAAGLLALAWALHPLRTEVVCWVSERKELLSVLFMLLTLILYVRPGRRPRPAVSRLHDLPPLCLYALALLAKPVAVSLPAVLLAWEVAMREDADRAARWRRGLLRVLPFAVLAILTCVLTMRAQTEGLTSGRTMPLGIRICCAVTAPIHYLRQTFWPVGLSIDYPASTPADWGCLACGGVLLAVLALVTAWWFARRNFWNSLGVFAIAWLYVGLVPMLGIVKVGVAPHSDRYTYWIGCGAAAVLAIAARRLVRFWRPCLRQVACGFGAVLAVLAVLTLARSAVWRNTETLFTDAVAKNHRDGLAYILALELLNQHSARSDERAEEMLRDVLAANHSPEAEGNLAFVLSRKKVLGEESAAVVREIEILCGYALAADPGCPTALAALAIKDYRAGHYRKAVETMDRAVACGYKPYAVEIDMEEWRKKAAEEKP